MDKTLFFSFILVVMVALSIAMCCVVAFNFVEIHEQNIALASDYNPNLLDETYFTFSFPAVSSSVDGLPSSNNKFVSSGACTMSCSNNILSFVVTGGFMTSLFGCDVSSILKPDTDYTLSVDVADINGAKFNLFCYTVFQQIQINTNPLNSSTFDSSGVCSFTFNTNHIASYKYVGLTILTNTGGFGIRAMKLEVGSTFTGFKSKDYDRGLQVGYDKGYDKGYDDGLEVNTYENPYFDNLPLSMYVSNQQYAEFGDFFNHNTITYNGLNYNSDYSDNSFEINNVYRYEFTAQWSNSNSLGISFNNVFNAKYFNISFGVDYHDNYNSLKAILIHNADYSNNYYYAVEGSNNVFKVRTEADNRAIYYTLQVELEQVDDYYISILFNDENIQGGDNISACLVLPFVVGSDVGNNSKTMQQAYEDGLRDGKDIGDISGYSRGVTDGQAIGYRQAMNEHGSYTLLGLFTSIVEAPVNVVGDVLDFELLGFNLKAFFYSMISIALFIFILKLFI